MNKWHDGKDSQLTAGLDEVGMGCIAGPLVICVAAFDKSAEKIPGVKDSKKCSATLRRKLAPQIIKQAQFIGLGLASAKTIDTQGIARAWQYAAKMALEQAPPFFRLVVDGTRAVQGYNMPQIVQPKADMSHWEVSAASIVAKVLRDSHMKSISDYYPGYGWETNAGYGTAEHNAKVISAGPTPIHRLTWIEKLLSKLA